MPTIICRGCGQTSNTALSNWMHSKDDKADACYARLSENKWEKGCGYDKGDHFTKQYVNKLIHQLMPYKYLISDDEKQKNKYLWELLLELSNWRCYLKNIKN